MTSDLPEPDRSTQGTPGRWLAVCLVALGVGMAAVAVLGPLVFGVLEHRTSDTTLNQLLGADAASLIVVAPFSVAVGMLAWRRHPAAPVLALAPATFAMYTAFQVVVGQEYLRLPGNVERFFPLLLAIFVVAEVVAVGAWASVAPERLPEPGPRQDRLAGVVLLVLAAFVVLGLHLPMLPDALSGEPTRVEYVSSPTPFWLVKMMDLGIVVPAAVATGLGLLRRRPWARKASFAILGGYTLIGASVAAMALVMLMNGDPDASVGLAVAFTAFTALLSGVTAVRYRPLLAARERRRTPAADRTGRHAASARAGDRP